MKIKLFNLLVLFQLAHFLKVTSETKCNSFHVNHIQQAALSALRVRITVYSEDLSVDKEIKKPKKEEKKEGKERRKR